MRTPEPAGRLDLIAEITGRRCPVRNLLADARVRLEMTWIAVPG